MLSPHGDEGLKCMVHRANRSHGQLQRFFWLLVSNVLQVLAVAQPLLDFFSSCFRQSSIKRGENLGANTQGSGVCSGDLPGVYACPLPSAAGKCPTIRFCSLLFIIPGPFTAAFIV